LSPEKLQYFDHGQSTHVNIAISTAQNFLKDLGATNFPSRSRNNSRLNLKKHCNLPDYTPRDHYIRNTRQPLPSLRLIGHYLQENSTSE
jgi:hypothetical protein